MLKNKRLVSFIAMLAICFSFLVPAFLAPDQAAASSSYTVLSAPTVQKGSSVDLGSVEIYIPNTSAFTQEYDYLTISMPSGVEVQPAAIVAHKDWSAFSAADGSATACLSLSLPSKVDGDTNGITADAIEWKISSLSSFELRIAGDNVAEGAAAKINVGFKKLNIQNANTGDVQVTFVAPTSGETAFTTGTAVIGRISSDKGTTAFVKSVKNVAKATEQQIDTINIAETTAGSIAKDTIIKLKLPSGVKWSSSTSKNKAAYVKGSWAFDGLEGSYTTPDDFEVDGLGSDTLKIKVATSPARSTAGRISIGVTGSYFYIDVDDKVANGDIVCSISGENGDGITDQDIVIAKVGDYGITVTEGEKKEVIAGRKNQKLGSFYIEESLPGSLVSNRSIKLTLPDGVKWDVTQSTRISLEETNGVSISDNPSYNSTYSSLTFTVDGVSTTSAGKIKLYDGKVQISPAFSGPIKITISGTAGVTGEVTVAECVPAVTMTADASKSLIIGLPNQAASDITITEGKKGAILDSTEKDYFDVALPTGVTFASLPTVKVVEGNLDIDSYKLVSYNNVTDAALRIKIKSSSSQASKIVISNVKLTLDRTVPEGQLKAKLVATDETYPLDETNIWTDRDGAGSVVIGTCVTPAPANQGRSALFTIGSNIATMNGSYVIMDTAPYIKASRTYIPVRYLADALGATTEWDPATQTATLTLGDKSVVLVIGSKVEKVNGADVTMDVAPEIVNGRTMLPARYVAEGLGYQVGWNGVTKQVIIQ